MPFSCDICGRPVKTGRRGRPRLRHDGCAKTHEALAQLERVLDPRHIALVGYTDEALRELRYRIFLLATEVPRPRDALGRFTPR